jgi:membrane protease YdiL (CAAX protease family)
MPEQRTTSEFLPPRTDRPQRQILVFLCSTYAIAVAIALALPHAGIAPMLSIVAPVLGFAITLAFVVPRGQRRAVVAAVGFSPRRGRGLLIAVVGPVLMGAFSFSVAAALGVVRFPGLGVLSVSGGLNFLVGAAVSTVVFLGEEIGWRGFLLFRLAEVTGPRMAAILTGACHAIFHLPLLLLTTTYQSAGERWIVVPTVMITITLAGVWYAWLRLSSGSIWPVCLSHSVFNSVMESLAGVAIVTSAAAMAYVTTETGIATMIIMVGVAAFLLVRKAADFDKARPAAHRPTIEPRVKASHER